MLIPVLPLYPLEEKPSAFFRRLGAGKTAVSGVSQSSLLPSQPAGCFQNDLSKWKCFLLAPKRDDSPRPIQAPWATQAHTWLVFVLHRDGLHKV